VVDDLETKACFAQSGSGCVGIIRTIDEDELAGDEASADLFLCDFHVPSV
jgi:hypothetical protein